MTDTKKYNIFILLSTISRNIIEIFSSVLLYKMGYSVKDIMLFYVIMYVVASFTNISFLYLLNIINYKYLLIISSIIYSYSFYYLNNMTTNTTSLIFFSIMLSIGSYSYHSIRHYLAMKVVNNNRRINIGNILIFTYLAYMLSSYLGAIITNKMGLFYVIIIILILSIFSIIPIMNLKSEKNLEPIKLNIKNISKNRILFFIFEQFKVIFLTLQPLYLFIYVENNIEYIGIFNIIMGLSSIIFVYFFVRKLNVSKSFWYLNIFFCFTLIFKINLLNNYLVLIIAFLEGLFSRMYEVVSSENLYECDSKNIISYLMLVELLFCFTNIIVYFICYLLNINIKMLLYICIIGIFLSGFVRYKKLEKKQ